MQQINCVVVGDVGIGKTSMLFAFYANIFRGDYVPKLYEYHGYDRCSVEREIKDRYVNLIFWDTTEGDMQDRIRCKSYSSAEIILLCFSVVSPLSFKSIKTKWMPEIRQECQNIPILLIGTKVDLRENKGVNELLHSRKQSPITKRQGIELAKEIGAITYMECSSLEFRGANDIVLETAKTIIQPRREKTEGCRTM